MTEQQAAETTRRWARFHFRRMPHVKGSLDYLGTNGKERIERVYTFEKVITRLNDLIDHPDQISRALTDVHQLRHNMDGHKIPTLETITQSPTMARAVQETFEYGKQDFPSWADSAMRSPTMPAVGVFLEGFGYFLGALVHRKKPQALNTKRSFVMSFEEVLAMEHPDSTLLADVIDWMREESASFPNEIQSLLA